MTIKLIIGITPNVTAEVEGTIEEVLREAAFFQSIPHECPICQSALRLTYRTPKNRGGVTLNYFGLLCDGKPAHECQFSKRTTEKGGGLFIREGNRQDGQPNWRLAYGHRDEEEEHDDHHVEPPSRSEPRTATAGVSSNGSRIGQPGFLTQSTYNELLRVASTKGMGEAELNQFCIGFTHESGAMGVRADCLTVKDAIAFRKVLLEL